MLPTADGARPALSSVARPNKTVDARHNGGAEGEHALVDLGQRNSARLRKPPVARSARSPMLSVVATG